MITSHASDGTLHHRLSRDAYAPRIRELYTRSTCPGQKAERILLTRIEEWEEGRQEYVLDKISLATVLTGKEGMRAWTESENKLIQFSKKRIKAKKQLQWMGIFGLLLVGIAVTVFFQRTQEENKNRMDAVERESLSWYEDCIEHGGKWDRITENDDKKCIGGTFALPDFTADFKYIPQGEFIMGSDSSGYEDEAPAHRVVLSNGFWLGRTEVTQGQWYAVMGNNPSYFKGDSLPVENVSWNDIQQFLQELNKKSTTGAQFALPTEAQWEYACRGGRGWDYPYNEAPGQLSDYAWYDYDVQGTQIVGKKLPNAFGLHDMSGNVWEWVGDAWEDSTYKNRERDPSIDPVEKGDSSSYRVLRGGSFDDSDHDVRCAYRLRLSPSRHGLYIGFRLVALPPSD